MSSAGRHGRTRPYLESGHRASWSSPSHTARLSWGRDPLRSLYMSNVAPPHEGPDPTRAGAPAGFATDDIDHALARARALIDAALLQHQRMSSERLVDELPDDDTVGSAGHGLIDEAQQEVLCALPTGG